jgi:hypothetical protein
MRFCVIIAVIGFCGWLVVPIKASSLELATVVFPFPFGMSPWLSCVEQHPGSVILVLQG